MIKGKSEALSKAEQVIRKLQYEVSNAKRVLDVNERELRLLKEQFRNLQSSYQSQETSIQKQEKSTSDAQLVKFEIREMEQKLH